MIKFVGDAMHPILLGIGALLLFTAEIHDLATATIVVIFFPDTTETINSS